MHSYGGQVGTDALVGLGAETRRQEGRPYVDRDPKTLLVGPAPGLEEKKVDACVAGLERWNGKCLYQGIHQCVWREIPVSYVYTTTDMAVP
ncbi:hypothetical protein ETB97_001988 [Aspergillus alliaceus]|uniref:Uncharacterized protein n=1 Tax=Petromyces alliaceus TaxID=209559 RepID=A0A8H6E6M9_PETAA|nr:hypothetical protein ETB97_001988 [Aspergillus burnettii]